MIDKEKIEKIKVWIKEKSVKIYAWIKKKVILHATLMNNERIMFFRWIDRHKIVLLLLIIIVLLVAILFFLIKFFYMFISWGVIYLKINKWTKTK